MDVVGTIAVIASVLVFPKLFFSNFDPLTGTKLTMTKVLGQ